MVFIYFLKGQLSRQGFPAMTIEESFEKIGVKKQAIGIQDLCGGFAR